MTRKLAFVPSLLAVAASTLILAGAVSGNVFSVPLRALVPDHAPLAVHEVALVDDQLNVAREPGKTAVGVAARLTVGGGPEASAGGRIRWTALVESAIQAKAAIDGT